MISLGLSQSGQFLLVTFVIFGLNDPPMCDIFNAVITDVFGRRRTEKTMETTVNAKDAGYLGSQNSFNSDGLTIFWETCRYINPSHLGTSGSGIQCETPSIDAKHSCPSLKGPIPVSANSKTQ